jgi:hypothetical protein
MARIKINDLPKDMKVSKEELRMIRGGVATIYTQQPISIEKGNTPAFGLSFSVDAANAWYDALVASGEIEPMS